jgi:hypothetical protein
MIQMISPTGKFTNSITMAMIVAPIVAPTTGIRSKKNVSSASAPANGAPRIVSMMKVPIAAVLAWTSAPPM